MTEQERAEAQRLLREIAMYLEGIKSAKAYCPIQSNHLAALWEAVNKLDAR